MCTAIVLPESATTRLSAELTVDLFIQTPARDLADALMQLSTTERLVLGLLYFNDLPIEDVVAVLRLNSDQVLKIHNAALLHLSEVVSNKRASGKPRNLTKLDSERPTLSGKIADLLPNV